MSGLLLKYKLNIPLQTNASDNGKPVERRGRKATGPEMAASYRKGITNEEWIPQISIIVVRLIAVFRAYAGHGFGGKELL